MNTITARDKKCDFEYGDFPVPLSRLVRHASPGYRIRSGADRQDRSVQMPVFEEAHFRWNLRLVFRTTTTDYLQHGESNCNLFILRRYERDTIPFLKYNTRIYILENFVSLKRREGTHERVQSMIRAQCTAWPASLSHSPRLLK